MSANPQNAVERLRETLQGRKDITKRDFELEAGSTVRQREKVASVQFQRPQVLTPDKQVRLAPMAYEEFTTDGTADNTESFALSHDLIDSGATSRNLVLYDDGALVSPDSIDYDANSFEYTDSGTGSTLAVYYAAADQAPISIVKQNAGGIAQELWTGDIGLLHRRDNDKEPITLSFTNYLERVIPRKWELAVYVNTPYQVAWAKDVDGDSDPEPAINALLEVPRQPGTTKIDGLRALVRQSAASR